MFTGGKRAGEQRGKSLDATTKAELAEKLGLALDDVRVFDDEAAAARAQKLGAVAYTSGSEIHFADGKYDPHSTEGKRLLAHELAHVKQQRGQSTAATGQMSAVGSAVEREADRVADAVVGGAKAGTASLEVKETAAAGRSHARTTPRLPPAALDRREIGRLRFLSQAIDIADLAQSTDVGDGWRLTGMEGRKLGPVKIDEVKVQWLDGAVARGTVKASIDDGRFKGSSAQLSVDTAGNVTGQLNVEFNVPGASSRRCASRSARGRSW